MNRSRVKTVFILFFIAAACLMIGCSKLTTDNYNKLEIGMVYDEVISLIGTADSCDGALGVKSCTWGNDTRHIKIKFIGDKVVIFSGKGL